MEINESVRRCNAPESRELSPHFPIMKYVSSRVVSFIFFQQRSSCNTRDYSFKDIPNECLLKLFFFFKENCIFFF